MGECTAQQGTRQNSKKPLFPNWLPSTQRIIFLRARPAELPAVETRRENVL